MRQHRNLRCRALDFLKIFEINVIYSFYLSNETFDFMAQQNDFTYCLIFLPSLIIEIILTTFKRLFHDALSVRALRYNKISWLQNAFYQRCFSCTDLRALYHA